MRGRWPRAAARSGRRRASRRRPAAACRCREASPARPISGSGCWTAGLATGAAAKGRRPRGQSRRDALRVREQRRRGARRDAAGCGALAGAAPRAGTAAVVLAATRGSPACLIRTPMRRFMEAGGTRSVWCDRRNVRKPERGCVPDDVAHVGGLRRPSGTGPPVLRLSRRRPCSFLLRASTTSHAHRGRSAVTRWVSCP